MAENWVTRWYGKFIKMPIVLRPEMNTERRKVFRFLRHMRFYVYQKIPKDVLEEHRVTQALDEQTTAERDAKHVVEEEFKLAFNAQVEETLTLKEIADIETALLIHESEHGSIGYEAQFGKKVLLILAAAQGEDKRVYFTYLEPAIKEAENRGNHKALMAQIKTMGTSQLNTLSAIALRLEIRAASRSLRKIRADKQLIKHSLAEWDKAKQDKKAAEQHLKNALAEAEIDMETDLHNETLITMRDFLLVLLTLQCLNDNADNMMQYYRDNVMPKIPEEEHITDVEKIKEKLAEHAHTLAQGLRRILAAEEHAQKLAQQVEAVAESGRKATA